MGRHTDKRNIALVVIYMFVCPCVDSQCDDGWLVFRHSCYLFAHNRKASFVLAEDYCRQHGGYIVHPNNAEENNFLKGMVAAFGQNYWIGITDETAEGSWRYYGTNQAIQFSDWHPGQPDSHKGSDEDCALYIEDDDHRWHDYQCMTTHAEPLCEKDLNNVLHVVG